MNISSVHGGEAGVRRSLNRLPEESRRVRQRTDTGSDRIEHACAQADTLANIMFAHPHLRRLRLNAADLANAVQRNKILDALFMHSIMPDTHMRELHIVGQSSDATRPVQELHAQDLQILKHIPTLEWLELDGVRLDKSALENVKHLTNLRALRFDRSELGNSKLECLQHAPALQHLELQGTAIAAGSLEQLRYVPHLRSLTLENAGVDGDELVHVAPLQKLTRLDLSRNEDIEDEHLASIDRLAQLERLDVAHTSINGTGFEELPNLELRALRWNTGAFGDDYETLTPEIAELTSLEELSIGGGNLEHASRSNREGLEPLRALTNLRRLNIDRLDNVYDSDLTAVAEMKGLEEVDLTYSAGFTRAGLEGLLANPTLRKVKITDTDVAPLAAELQAQHPHCCVIGD